jgi:hypothetical protein
MAARRILPVLALLGAVAAFSAAPAAAARPASGPLSVYPETLSTDHFQVHYTGELASPANPDRILQSAAGDLAANAERAYSLFVATWGFPAPKNDGDGKVDIWVQEQDAGKPLVGIFGESPTPPETVWASIDPTKAQDPHLAAFIVMTAIEAGLWWPADDWLLSASSEWASFAAAGYDEVDGSTAPSDISLDCNGDSCGDLSYDIAGDSRWPFFQYLSERFGNDIVKQTFAKGAALNDFTKTGRDLLQATLVDQGTTLGNVFNEWTAAHVAGAYAVEGLKGKRPATHATIALGLFTATYPAQKINVNHLAARYVKLTRNTSNTGQCYAATVNVTVALPPGSTARPSISSTSLGSTALPLTVDGATASAAVPWDTCAAGGDAYLALPNPSLTADGQTFTVAASLAVGNVSMTAPSTPPPSLYTGAAVAAPTAELAPSILVHGAETIRVPAATRLVRLVVFASGAGQLRAAVGDTVIGTVTLRAGNNDVRLVLPATLKAFRRTAGLRAADTTLSLTSLAADGTAGATVARKLVVTEPPAPPKKKTTSRR